MHLQVKRTDICQTCIHVSECAHYQHCKDQGRAILHCENFDDRPVLHVVEKKTLHDAEPSTEPSMSSISYVPGRMKGLCINCENRVSCRYPIREAGVWHCEEYC